MMLFAVLEYGLAVCPAWLEQAETERKGLEASSEMLGLLMSLALLTSLTRAPLAK